MISLKGYDEIIEKVYDNKQEHIFDYWQELSNSEKESLLKEVATIDFDLMKKLYSDKSENFSQGFKPAPYIAIAESADDKKKFNEAKKIGEDHIRAGKSAAFIVAGGQGSRLGYEGPKGMYPVGPISNKTLFQIHAEKILKSSQKYGVNIPWLIMTSQVNHNDTVEYLSENKFFGLNENDVIIFPQNMIPSLDSEGKLILKNKSGLFMNPDGHGGSLTALATSGALEKMGKRGIETISYFQVDNPLVNIIDPVFIGFHVQGRADISSKALKKAYPEEKVGVFVEFDDNKIGVVEYSDLPDEKANLKDDKDNLLFSAGSIAIHLFNREFIERITSGSELSLPYHTASKKIKAFKNNNFSEISGFKFEKFVFDALPLTDKNIVMEILREEEFAPVKNASGVDSVDTARELMVNLYMRWLNEREIEISDVVEVIEISPLLAIDADDLDDCIEIADKEKVYLE